MNYKWLCEQTTSHIKYISLDPYFLEELYTCKYWNFYNLFCLETNCGLNCYTLNYILGNHQRKYTKVKNFNKLGSYIVILEGESFTHSMTLIVEQDVSMLFQSYMKEYYMRFDKVDRFKFLRFLKNLKNSEKYIFVKLPLNERYTLEILHYGPVDYHNIPNNLRLLESFGANYRFDICYHIFSIVFRHIALLLLCCK